MQYMGKYGTKTSGLGSGLDPRIVFILSGLGLLAVVGLVALMFVDVPAPQAPIQTQLDAKQFLENK